MVSKVTYFHYNTLMINIQTDKLSLTIDNHKLKTLRVESNDEARALLANIWDTETSDLINYYAVFFNKQARTLGDEQSFITLSFSPHGYVMDSQEQIDIAEAQKQIEIDLEIINREAQWGAEDSIYFDEWWPKPHFSAEQQMLEFGISLKDFHKKVFNRTLNRLILTRYGHIMINYSLSENDLNIGHPLSYYQKRLDEVLAAINIKSGYRYSDVNEDEDFPSKSRMINLVLSSEIF